MSHIKTIVKASKHNKERIDSIRVRKHLNADTLIATLRNRFEAISDKRAGNATVALVDALMSGFAMFSLKDPSLLQFDLRRKAGGHNLRSLYGINTIPSDSAMREILDAVSPDELRLAFKDIFRPLQRGKLLEKMTFIEGCYLLNLAGTGYFSSKKRHSPCCMQKVNSKTGEITYYLQMLGAAIVHPDQKKVIPLCPEIIMQQDGTSKNDCERNAAKRFIAHLRREHPHLPLIINEDPLSSNAPHIRDLQEHNLHYILGVKPGDHEFLFQFVDNAAEQGKTTEFVIKDDKKSHIHHCFRLLNDVPLNASNQELRVNFIEYWQTNTKTGKTRHFTWVTDFTVTPDNALQIMRGGRARWKIENETFNTLKNQGYHFEHNYGLGNQHLSTVFVLLMTLAFLVDQVQQLCCQLFNAALKRAGGKKNFWDWVRSLFRITMLDNMEQLYRAILTADSQKLVLRE